MQQAENLMENNEKKSVIKFLRGKNIGVFLAFIVLFIILSLASSKFLTFGNIMMLTRQAVWFAIMGFGMTFVIAMRGIDLSVGSTLAICGLFLALMIQAQVNIYLAIFIVLGVGTLIGIINGLIIAKVGIVDFIATLAVMSITRGIVMVISKGLPIYGLQFSELQFFGQGYIGPVPFPIVLTVIIMVICFYLMYRTKLGRYTLSIGSNPEAAKLVGINIDKIKITVYAMMGLLSAIAGLIITSRLEAAMPDAGTGYELQVIAATVIGGTSMAGGRASVIGTAIGAILMSAVQNGLNLLNVNTFWQQTVIGCVILMAVIIDKMSVKGLKSYK